MNVRVAKSTLGLEMIKADSGNNTKPRICFVAQNAYGALAGVDTGHIGGIERQQSMMARWLANRGLQVSMVTWDEGQEDGIVLDGVSVFKMCREEAGIKGLRFLWPKWTSLCGAMRRADADIYYYNCGDLGLGQVVMWCRRYGRKCLYSVASNPDCDHDLPVLKELHDSYKRKLRIIGVNSGVGDVKDDIRDYGDEYEIRHDLVFDKSGRITSDYGVFEIPTYIMINKRGRITYRGNTPLLEEEIESRRSELIE